MSSRYGKHHIRKNETIYQSSVIFREIEEGSNPENSERKPSAPPVPAIIANTSTIGAQVSNVVTTTARATLMSPVARFAMTKPSTAPPHFEFSLGHPANLAMIDMDVIKLTAQ